MSEWISVEDAMPSHGDTVLTYSYGDVSVADYYGDNRGWVDQCDGKDVREADGYKVYLHVSHWMSLPEAPEDERNIL